MLDGERWELVEPKWEHEENFEGSSYDLIFVFRCGNVDVLCLKIHRVLHL